VNPNQQQGNAWYVMTSIKWAVGAVLMGLSVWCAMVGFNGGRIPVFGNHVRGSGAHGVLWLFIAGSFAFGIFEACALAVDTATRNAKRVTKPSALHATQGD
jgi:hypothetical protein